MSGATWSRSNTSRRSAQTRIRLVYNKRKLADRSGPPTEGVSCKIEAHTRRIRQLRYNDERLSSVPGTERTCSARHIPGGCQYFELAIALRDKTSLDDAGHHRADVMLGNVDIDRDELHPLHFLSAPPRS